MQIIARSPYHVLKSYGLDPGAASGGGAVLLERLSDGAAVAFEAEAAALALAQLSNLEFNYDRCVRRLGRGDANSAATMALSELFRIHWREPASA